MWNSAAMHWRVATYLEVMRAMLWRGSDPSTQRWGRGSRGDRVDGATLFGRYVTTTASRFVQACLRLSSAVQVPRGRMMIGETVWFIFFAHAVQLCSFRCEQCCASAPIHIFTLSIVMPPRRANRQIGDVGLGPCARTTTHTQPATHPPCLPACRWPRHGFG